MKEGNEMKITFKELHNCVVDGMDEYRWNPEKEGLDDLVEVEGASVTLQEAVDELFRLQYKVSALLHEEYDCRPKEGRN
jgi:hypothetical protein